MPLTTWDETAAHRGGSIRESLQNWIANASPKETPLLSGLDQVQVFNGLVEWLEDTYGAATLGGVNEGIAFAETGLTMPSRLGNIVQIFYKGGIVGDKTQQVTHAGGDPLDYQMDKCALEVKRNIEKTLHCGTVATGATDSVPLMGGMLGGAAFQVTGVTLLDNSGATLTELKLNFVLENIWANSAARLEEMYCNRRVKRTVSGYTANRTLYLDATDRRMVVATDVYTSDFGNVRIYPSRDQLISSSTVGSGNSFIVIDPTYYQTGWLQPLTVESLSRDGLRDRFQISASCTLIYKSRYGGGGSVSVIPAYA